MRRVRFGDGTGAVTGVSDGGDLEGIPFLPPAPPTGPTGTAAVPGAAPVPDVAPVPGIGPMPVVASALPAAAAASIHSIGSPAPNAAAGEVGPTGATPDQVRQALNASNLSVTGAGFTVGVLSDSFDYLGGAAADEADGALPPASQVQVPKDLLQDAKSR